jgi:hypothetical protein
VAPGAGLWEGVEIGIATAGRLRFEPGRCVPRKDELDGWIAQVDGGTPSGAR